VNPWARALTRWVEGFANASANLDPLTRTRLGALAGHSIAVEIDPPGETTTLHFESDTIRLSPGPSETPSVIVRGDGVALAAAFFGASGGRRDGITIEGDDVILREFRAILADFRPDIPSPLADVVGREAAQTLTSVVELGFAAVAALGRSLADESGRLVRRESQQRYLGAAEFESLQEATRALRVRLDRLAVRIDTVEKSRSDDNG
jgi:ubiquinone biosynthesis protein UbiJ